MELFESCEVEIGVMLTIKEVEDSTNLEHIIIFTVILDAAFL